MTLKQKALAHYDRMIEWAKKQPKKNKCDRVNMYYHISETWSGSHCPYRQKMSEKDLNCSYCRLHADNDDENCCCDGTWMDMANAETQVKLMANMVTAESNDGRGILDVLNTYFPI